MRASTDGIHEPRAGDGALRDSAAQRLIYIPEARQRATDFRAGRSTIAIGRHAFRLRVEVRDDAVAQHRVRQRADVVEADVIAAARQRARLAAEHEVLRRADAGAERHPLLDEVLRRRVVLRPRRADDVERVAHHRLGHRHLAHQLLERDQIVAADRPLELRILNRRRRPDDVDLLVVRRVLDDDVEHEAVELRFRQRIRAFELDRVLRREHVERLGELVGLALHGDAMLLHRLEQRRLRLRRRAVDFVREHDVREDRTGREHHLPAAGRRVFLHEVGAGDVATASGRA